MKQQYLLKIIKIILIFTFSVLSMAEDLKIDKETIKQMPQIINDEQDLESKISETITNTVQIDKLEKEVGKIIEIKTYPQGVKKHPIFTHFAIALPFAVFLVSIFALLKYKRLSITDLVLLLISSGVIYFTFMTGLEAYKIVLDKPMIEQASKLLIEHKKMGSMLLVLTAGLLLLRIILTVYRPVNLVIFYLFIFVIYLALILYQGKIGINTVYNHGVGIYYDPLNG